MNDPGTLFSAFSMAARRFGMAAAIHDDGCDTSYTTLLQEARRAGRALIASGIEPGDRVAIWAVNHRNWIVAGLGILAAGATLVPIGTRLKGTEAGAVIRRAKCKAIFTDPRVAGYDLPAALASEPLLDLQTRYVFGQSGSWRAFMALGDTVSEDVLDLRIARTSPDDLADIIYTSGTTGAPKGVPMSHAQSLIACAQQQLDCARFQVGETYPVFFPFAHNAGYRAGWQAGLLNGTRIIPVRGYDSASILDIVESQSVAVLSLVPTLFQTLLDDPTLPHRNLRSLRYASTGAATIPVALITRMRTELGARQVATGYGLTEAAGSVSNTRAGDSDEVVALTTGRPLDNLTVRILRPDQTDQLAGEAGEIAVRGPQVLKGYYEDPEANAKAFTSDGFLLTGDVGLITLDGNLRITDRIKDMYLCGGFNCYPAEIESVLRRHDAIADVAVIGLPDLRLGEVGGAFVVLKPGKSLDQATLLAWAKPLMANYKLPRSVILLPGLPLNATGKIDKTSLRIQYRK